MTQSSADHAHGSDHPWKYHDHVLEEVRMSRSINDSAVTFSGLKLP
ncbi:unnamed protein product, partial [Vitis vinifera]|uniref:Uncharacterized protein n=1 Tax=Vitis vinifera TaxID=29760 RepID=D7U811_VITVI